VNEKEPKNLKYNFSKVRGVWRKFGGASKNTGFRHLQSQMSNWSATVFKNGHQREKEKKKKQKKEKNKGDQRGRGF